jgi:hypothetical protein
MRGERLYVANKIARRYLSLPYNHWLRNDARWFGKLRKTRVLCSSIYCCGNRRPIEGPTIQEKRLPQYLSDIESDQ